MKSLANSLNDGTAYSGPTHETKGRLMTGSTHTANSKYLTDPKPKPKKKKKTKPSY
jgi:hypothetical protein